MDLQSKTVLMTGAQGGIGRALALELAQKGVHFILLVRRADAGLAEELSQLGSRSVEFHEIDLSDAQALDRLLRQLAERTIDVVINNAGLLTGGLLEEQSPIAIQTMFQVNLLSAVQITRALLPGMLKNNSGLIVNNSSVSGRMFLPCATTYAASKAGLAAFTDSLRRELKGTGVRTLLLITPGIKTRMFDQIDGLYGGHLKLPLSSISPTQYAREIVQKIDSNAETLTPNGATGLVLTLARLCPKLFDWWISHYFSRKADS